MEEDVEKIFKDFILNTPKNDKSEFNIGNIVESYNYRMEYSINCLKVNKSMEIIRKCPYKRLIKLESVK
jgi:hypothetical protein